MKNYFPHDHFARSDKKLVNLLRKQGMAGIGLYWCLVEMLYEENGWLQLDDLENIAFDLRIDKDQINSLINDFDLFFIADSQFSSHSVLARLQVIEIKSSKAAKAAQTRWQKCKADANALKKNANALRTHNPSIATEMQSHEPSNAIKENKIKESKEDIIGTDVPALSDFEKFELIRKEYPGTKRGPKTEWDEFKKKFGKEINTDFLRTIWLGLDAKRKTHKELMTAGQFVPEWPHFKTYLNQRKWEERTEVRETPAPEPKREPSAFKSLQEHFEYWSGTATPKPTTPTPA